MPNLIKARYYKCENNVPLHPGIAQSSFFLLSSLRTGFAASSAARGVHDELVCMVGGGLHFIQEECRHVVLHASAFN